MGSSGYQNHGLSSDEAKNRLKKNGPNTLFQVAKVSFWSIAKEEITEPIILLLFAIGFFYSIWGKLGDTITIIFVISGLVFTEVYNEFRAKKAITSLGEITAPKAKVLRDGKPIEVKAEEIVIGDILLLFSGSKITADSKILICSNLTVDESALTGESFPVEKENGNEIFAGTSIISGEAQAEVIKTGLETKFGKIAENLMSIKPQKTKLQLEMKHLAGKLLYWSIAISIIVPIIGVLRGQDLKVMLLTGLALSFAIIPEELPMVITMVLGLGSYNLSKKNFLVKKIKAAEVLGTVTTIVTDKTGTLTKSLMTPVFFFPIPKKEIIDRVMPAINIYSPSALDQAILRTSKKDGLLAKSTIIRQRDIGDGKKTIAVLVKNNGDYELIIRGAPEDIFFMSKKVDAEVKQQLTNQTKNGIRMIAVASKPIKISDIHKSFESLEKEVDFIGLIGFEDPPRENVKDTISKVCLAGIRTIMITGDHPETAASIARQVGIKSNGKEVLTGEDIAKMSDYELSDALKQTSIFARTSPQDKYRVVKSLQASGEIVGVTGDGINDVLALKMADIGIAMGIKGTDVAKEAASAVLADDNYVTITNGIFEGRKLFDNLKKGIKYYLSVKLALVLVFLVPVLFGIIMPFAPIQIIVLELFMDLAASAGFVSESIENDVYGNFKDQARQGVLGKKSVTDIIFKSLVLFLTVMAVYLFALSQNYGQLESQTLAFAAWVFSHVFLAFVSRSDRQSIFSIGLFKNKIINFWGLGASALLALGIYIPALRISLNLTYVSILQIFVVMIFALFMASIVEIKKLVRK